MDAAVSAVTCQLCGWHGPRDSAASHPCDPQWCAAQCERRRCALPPEHTGSLHELPDGEQLSTSGRHFGDLYPTGWHAGDGLDDARTAHAARVRELSRMSKDRLRDVSRRQLAAAGIVTLHGGPDVLSKDELIAAILRREFPGEDRCDPDLCPWPFGEHSIACAFGTS